MLAKVRISGGGRCNVTHACFDPEALVRFYPRGARELRGAFSRFQPQDTLRWFETRGVLLKTETDGRVFPVSDSSSTITACLSGLAARYGIQVRTRANVTGLRATPDRAFHIQLQGGDEYHSRRVLLACGGARGGFALASGLGHTIQPPVPSLFTFAISDPRLAGMQGVAVPNAHLTLPAARLAAEGALLVTHWGLSGPAVLRLSAWGARELHACNYQALLVVDWIAPLNAEGAATVLDRERTGGGRKNIHAHSPFPGLPQRLWSRFAEVAGIPDRLTWANLTREQQAHLIRQLTQAEFHMTGKGEFKEEFVTCGGVTLKEVDFKRMESRVVPGLHFAGEILDIDGLTGGFNFQNAWTTGWIAGKALAESLSAGES